MKYKTSNSTQIYFADVFFSHTEYCAALILKNQQINLKKVLFNNHGDDGPLNLIKYP